MKTKYIHTLLILSLCTLFTISCSKDNDEELRIEIDSIIIPAIGGTRSFEVTANTGWSASSQDTWLTILKENENSVKVSAKANTTSSTRNGTITCNTNGGMIKTIRVSQTVTVGAQKDSAALVALYESTDGSAWTRKWILYTPLSHWPGVTVKNGRVVKLQLSNNNLTGELPAELGALDKLEYCDLSANKLSGAIPADLNNLTLMNYLDLSDNSLSGDIPSLSGLTKLTMLDLSINRLSGGAISSFLPQLTAIEYLGVHDNNISGSLPNLGNLIKLQYLDMSKNNFSGTIPSSWSTLTKLKLCYLYSNSLSGNIPDFIIGFSLKELALDYNNFDGTIPPDLGYITSLEQLWLSMNKLTGSIPLSLLNNSNWNNWKENVCPQQGSGFDNCNSIPAPAILKRERLKEAKITYNVVY